MLQIWLEMEKCIFLFFGESSLFCPWEAELSLHTPECEAFDPSISSCVVFWLNWPDP